MKKAVGLLAIILAILIIVPAVYAKGKELKIGYVDLYKVFSGYEETRESEAALEKKAEKKNKEREKKVNEIKKLQEEAELLAANAKEKKEEAIEDKLKALRDFDRATREELNRERDSMGRDVLIEINKTVTEFGEKEGYDLILDSRSLFYAGESVDLSDKIIKRMNK